MVLSCTVGGEWGAFTAAWLGGWAREWWAGSTTQPPGTQSRNWSKHVVLVGDRNVYEGINKKWAGGKERNRKW
jgi:hypothetical protein